MKTNRSPLVGIFEEHQKRKGVYDLCTPSQFPFCYIVISEAKSTYLKKVKAFFILNCWTGKKKVLHTGLIEFEHRWFFGDNINNQNSKDFILLRPLKEKKLVMYLFQNFNPKNKVAYGKGFVKTL